MIAAIPADALGGLSADMVAAIPADAGFVAPTIGEPGFEAFDTAQDPSFVVPTIDQPEFPADFVAPTFDPEAGGFQTEPGGPGLTEEAANDPNFVAPTIGEPGFAEFDAGLGAPADGTVDPGADFVGIAPEPADPGNFAADSQPGAVPIDVPPTAALDDAFAPEPAPEPVPTFDPVAEQVSVVADAGASQGAAPAPEPVIAESAPEPAPAPEPVVDDAPPPAPEPDIV
jgi:hypothetical protein